MKNLLRQAEVTVRSGVQRMRTWFDPPLTADARPLEIKEAIVEQIEQCVEPAGQGRRVLPYNQIRVTVLAATGDDRARLEATLDGVERAARARLGEIRCDIPTGFALTLTFVAAPEPAWAADQRFDVAFDTAAVAQAAPAADTDAATADPPGLRIRVVRGTAVHGDYELTDRAIRIGRTEAPVDSRGRVRKNHVAFVEDDDEASRTVGRAHASIHWDRVRHEYRIFDDGSHNGTRVVRNGMTLDVLPRDPVGVALQSGDEIELGTAAIRVEIGGDRGDSH